MTLVLASVVPLLGFTAYSHYLEYCRDIDATAARTLVLARSISQLIDQELQVRASALETLASVASLQSGDLDEFRAFAELIVARQFPGANIVLLRPDGQVLMSTPAQRGATLPVRPDLESIRQVLATKQPAVSNLFQAGVVPRLIAAIDVPVLDNNGAISYILSLNPRLQVFAEAIERQHLPSNWVVSVFDRLGRIVARTHASEQFLGQEASSGLIGPLRSQREGTLDTITLEGIPVLTAFAHGERFGWGVAIGIPRAELIDPIVRREVEMLLIGGVLLLISLFVAWYAAQSISRPISSLRNLTAVSPDQMPPLPAPTGLPEVDEVANALYIAESARRESRRTEAERQRAEKRAEDLQSELLHVSRLSTMGQMASTLAHELNQPLTAVTSYLQGLRRIIQTGKADRTQAIDVIDKAVEQAARAGQVIRRLREFVAKGETDRRREDLNKVIEEAVALAIVEAKQHAVDISMQLDSKCPGVLIDKIQIQQVVLNLIRNAIEAMEQSDYRELSISTLLYQSGKVIEVRVTDTGPGLAPEVVERLFEPFLTTKKTGMGLGLSICREIVEAHGGRISVSPNIPSGTTFSVVLPVAHDEEHDHER